GRRVTSGHVSDRLVKRAALATRPVACASAPTFPETLRTPTHAAASHRGMAPPSGARDASGHTDRQYHRTARDNETNPPPPGFPGPFTFLHPETALYTPNRFISSTHSTSSARAYAGSATESRQCSATRNTGSARTRTAGRSPS